MEEYVTKLLGGEKISPIEAIKVPGKGIFIVEGHHRYVASKKSGIPIEINIVEGQGPIGMSDWTGVGWKSYESEEQFWGD